MKFRVALQTVIRKSIFKIHDFFEFSDEIEGVRFIIDVRKLFKTYLDEKQQDKLDQSIKELLDEKYAIKLKLKQ